MPIEIKEIVFGSPDYNAEVQLRDEILRKPLGLKFDPKELLKENTSIHFGAFANAQLVGCLMLSPQPDRVMKMRQVAVSEKQQRLGVGRKLVEGCETKCRHLAITKIELNAREAVVPFYLKMGYEIVGETFGEVGLPHRKMQKLVGN